PIRTTRPSSAITAAGGGGQRRTTHGGAMIAQNNAAGPQIAKTIASGQPRSNPNVSANSRPHAITTVAATNDIRAGAPKRPSLAHSSAPTIAKGSSASANQRP